jgi:hypothetical protein
VWLVLWVGGIARVLRAIPPHYDRGEVIICH